MGKRILVAVIFVPILFVIMMFLPPVVWTAVVAAILVIAAHELFRSTGEGRITLPMKVISMVSAAAIPFGCWLGLGSIVIPTCMFIVIVVSFWCAIRSFGKESAIKLYQILLSVFGGVIIPAALSALVVLKCMDQGRYLVLFAVTLTFVTDCGAYFAGVFLGKHRGITQVSPNKSLEGYIGGFISGAVYAVIYGLIIKAAAGVEPDYLPLILCGLIGALVTELGDLSFSLIKRQYGIKDYGKLLPGHGGMLDRFDSMLFCGPVVLFIATLLPIF